jgi:hypothetical protein
VPCFSSIDPIVARVTANLQSRQSLIRTSSDLVDVVEPLTKRKAAQEVARIVRDMVT